MCVCVMCVCVYVCMCVCVCVCVMCVCVYDEYTHIFTIRTYRVHVKSHSGREYLPDLGSLDQDIQIVPTVLVQSRVTFHLFTAQATHPKVDVCDVLDSGGEEGREGHIVDDRV